MTEEQLAAIRAEITTALSAQQNRRTRKEISPFAVAGLVLAILTPISGGVAWLMTISGRVAVLESQSQGLTNAAVQIGALKQELTDFRGEFREWKSDKERESAYRNDQVKKGPEQP
jgi:hypothetical protein